MAIKQPPKVTTLSVEERTWRVNIETALGTDPVVTVWREAVTTDVDGTVVSREPVSTVQRTLSEVYRQTVNLVGGGTITLAQLSQAIADTADAWRTEDLADKNVLI